MPSSAVNPLLSSSRAADSHLSVQLHPLVILTISDYITRHTLRKQKSPIVGAILGAQNGRIITMEQAFECALEADKNGDAIMNAGWFHDRLQQYKDVHKAPALDLVGWFTIASPSGPEPHHLALHKQIMGNYNESVLLLTFHPTSIGSSASKSDKLPLAIYESVFEASTDEEDKSMTGEGPSLDLRFKELPYTIETGEAEMISMNFVAKGGANAASLATESSKSKATEHTGSKGNAKGKGRVKPDPADIDVQDLNVLTPEEEDAIAALTAKANAIRMLQKRISILKSYVDSLPPCYLNDTSITSCEPHPQISHTILRSTNSLLARLTLLTPSTPAPSPFSTEPNDRSQPQASLYSQETMAEGSDVALVSLLGSLGSALQSAQSMGKKSGIVEAAKASAARGKGGTSGLFSSNGDAIGQNDLVGNLMNRGGHWGQSLRGQPYRGWR